MLQGCRIRRASLKMQWEDQFNLKLINLPFCVHNLKIQILNDTHTGICPPENVKFLGFSSFERALFARLVQWEN